jgi:hypothetical protein
MARRRGKNTNRHERLWVWSGLILVAYLGYQEHVWTLIPWTVFVGLIYELLLVPTRCAARTKGGGSCDRNARGRLRACGLKAHQMKKRDAIWHYVTGLRNPLARYRKTWGQIEVNHGEVVSSPMPAGVEKASRPGSLERLGITLAFISAAAGVISAINDLLGLQAASRVGTSGAETIKADLVSRRCR